MESITIRDQIRGVAKRFRGVRYIGVLSPMQQYEPVRNGNASKFAHHFPLGAYTLRR